jgi:hypothetical protein
MILQAKRTAKACLDRYKLERQELAALSQETGVEYHTPINFRPY